MSDETNYPPIRRVVTGHTKDKVARVMLDAPATNKKFPGPGTVSTLIWSSDATPADISIGEDFEDRGARILGSPPPANGSRFAIIDFPPGNKGVMHRTESLDYVIVMTGEIDMDMDDSTVKLRAGDVMVQRGTNHSWVNRGKQVARLAFVLLDGQPLGIGHALSRQGSAAEPGVKDVHGKGA